MLSDEQLEALLLDEESDRVERKEAFTDKEKICEAICAFANDLPNHQTVGIVCIGLTDDGRCAGLRVDDDLLKRLAAIRADGNILPLPDITVQKRVFQGCEVAVIEVHPADSPPVRFRGRTWVRVGPTRSNATRDQERRLTERRISGDLSFDQRSLRGASIRDLDLTLFDRVYLPSAVAPDVLQENQRNTEQQLMSLRFLDRDGTPSHAGVLVLGVSPRDWIPGAYLQFVRFEGALMTDPIRHQAELSGPLPDLMTQIDNVLEANISIRTNVTTSSTEVRMPDYPLAALQQLVRNAVLHRNYETSNAPVQVYWFSDRIEIHNPGGPFGRVTASTFGQPGMTDYRNPLLAEAMKVLGYVQRFGLGLSLANTALYRNGNPPWEYQGTTESTLLLVRRTT